MSWNKTKYIHEERRDRARGPFPRPGSAWVILSRVKSGNGCVWKAAKSWVETEHLLQEVRQVSVQRLRQTVYARCSATSLESSARNTREKMTHGTELGRGA